MAVFMGLLLAWLPLPTAVAGGIGVVLVALVYAIATQPLIGLAVALLAGPFGALENVILGGNMPIDSGQILLMLTLVAWVARGLATKRLGLPKATLAVPLLGYIFVTSLTLLGAASLILGLIEVSKWVQMWLVLLMVVDLYREKGEPAERRKVLYALLSMILLAGVSQAAIGIWQFGLRGHGPEHFLVLGRFYRAYGTFEQPNPFGGYIALNAALGLGAVLGFGKQLWGRWGTAGWRDWGGLAATAVVAFALVLALVMSWSRGAWLGFAAGVGVMVLCLPRKRWQGLALATLAAVLLVGAWQAGLMPASISARLASIGAEFRLGDVRGVDINDTNYAVLERLAFWQAAVNMAEAHPLLGVGFGNYGVAYADYALINWPQQLGHAHNYYLNLLAETGVVGLLAYVLVWMGILWHNLSLLSRASRPWRGLLIGLLAAWVALTTHHLVDKLYVNNIYIHLGAMLALQQLIADELQQENRKVHHAS